MVWLVAKEVFQISCVGMLVSLAVDETRLRWITL